MGTNAIDLDLQPVGCRSADNDPARPARVQGIAKCRPDIVRIKGLGPEQADFLAGGKDKLHRPMRQVLFADNLHCLDQGGNAGFVITAENGVTGAGKEISLSLDADSGTGFDRVHVTVEKQRFSLRCPVESEKEVAAFRAGITGRAIFKALIRRQCCPYFF